MRTFNYSAIREQKWDSEVLGLIAAIYNFQFWVSCKKKPHML